MIGAPRTNTTSGAIWLALALVPLALFALCAGCMLAGALTGLFGQ